MEMKKITLFICLACVFFGVSCQNNNQAKSEQPTVGTSTTIEGDSTLYGLACDGCTDSVLVFLPGKGGDPVTYDILEATTSGRVIGRPQVGDWVAVIVNGADTLKADMVIDLDQLKGTWVQMVAPTLRERVQQPDDPNVAVEVDSMIKSMMKPVEMGFALKRHYTAQAVGRRQAAARNDDSPVILPMPRNYTAWHVVNGQLVLTVKENADDTTAVAKVENDTADFVVMMKDSLVLRFRDGERSYYRKKTSDGQSR